MPRGNRFKDLSGQKFGKLTVIEEADRLPSSRNYRWRCLCDCGKETISFASNLLRGISTSCGCYGRNILGNATRRHGMTKTRIYKIWVGVRKRCYNPKMKSYGHYGGRGIKMSKRWDSFELFYEDMKDGYADNLTLDRFPDKNGDYEPGNCRWATDKVQQNNRNNNRLIELDGVTKTLAQWADFSGTGSATIGWRIRKGWTSFSAIYGKDNTTLSGISQYLIF